MKKSKPYSQFIFLKRLGIAFTLLIFLLAGSNSAQAQNILSPHLHCAKKVANDIVLEWTNTTNNCGPFQDYLIWYSTTPTGPFTLLATITNQNQTSYTHTGANNGNTVYYYYMTTEYNCPGSVSLSSDTINNNGPLPPVINYITVSGSLAELNWQKSASPQTFGYVIYLVLGPNKYQAVDTIYGANNTDFTIPGSSPNDSAAQYTIAAIDSCGQAGLIDTSYQRTIFAGAITDPCGGKGSISWLPYINWTGGVMKYKVYAVYSNGIPVLMDSTTGVSASFSYISQPTCVFVVAYQNGTSYSSQSNIICLPPNPQHPVADLFLRTATVQASGVNRLFYSVDPNSNVLNITVERSEGTDGANFATLVLLNPPASLNGILTYDDSTAINDNHSYYYRITMKDNCNHETTSDTVKTILLQGNAYTNFSNEVTWDDYKNTRDSLTGYILQRNTNAGWLTIQAFSPPQPPNDFLEQVQGLVGDSGTLCYVVTATALVTDPTGKTDTVTSRSNVLCLDEIIKIAMPNAFAPKGKNNVFKPVARFTGNKSYTLQVFDRWGGLIFSTNDFDTGWDGSYGGKPCQQGAYAYFLQVVDNLGQRTEQKGTVMLIR